MHTKEVTGRRIPDIRLTGKKIRRLIVAGTPSDLFRNKRILVLTPDATRTCPLPPMTRCLGEVYGPVCRRVNLGYLDPAGIDLDSYRGREREGILFVDHAGEILYKLKQGRPP